MPSSLVSILWPASVFFTAVLGFRVGRWWKTVQTDNRHTVTFTRRHSDTTNPTEASGNGNGDDGSWLPRPPTSVPKGWGKMKQAGATRMIRDPRWTLRPPR